MKNTLLVAAVVAVSSTASNAVQYSLSGTNFSDVVSDTVVTDNSGTPIAPGTGYAAIGSFSSDPAQLGASGLAGAFNPLVSAAFDGAAAAIGQAVDGFFSLTGAPDSADAPVVEAGGRAVYLVFGNGDNLAGSSQVGVVAINGSTFESAFAGPGPFALTGLGIAGQTAVIGSFGAPVDVSAGGNTVSLDSFRLVPEPSTTLLGAIAGIGLIARRRRA